jgi:hypothetical protein
MAASTRILYNGASLVGGAHLKNAVYFATLAKQELTIALNIANQVSANGVTPANLDGSTEFNAPNGTGTTLLNAIGSFITHLSNVTDAELAALNQGN